MYACEPLECERTSPLLSARKVVLHPIKHVRTQGSSDPALAHNILAYDAKVTKANSLFRFDGRTFTFGVFQLGLVSCKFDVKFMCAARRRNFRDGLCCAGTWGEIERCCLLCVPSVAGTLEDLEVGQNICFNIPEGRAGAWAMCV